MQVVGKVGGQAGERRHVREAGANELWRLAHGPPAPSSLPQVQPVLRGAGRAGPPPRDGHPV